MSRGLPSAPIEMTARQHRLLSEYSQKRTISHQASFRSQILVFASKGSNNMEIARLLNTTAKTVKKWRTRWTESYKQLVIFESGIEGQGVSDAALLQKMLSIIEDNPRKGAPKKITLAQENQIVAISCGKPKEYGIIMNKWTYEQIANVAMARGVIDSISSRYVGTIIKKK